MLADYSKSQKLLLNDWGFISRGLDDKVQRIEFYLESSDNGQFGMNTPAYFCIDGLVVKPISIEKYQLKNQNLSQSFVNLYYCGFSKP